MFNKIKDLILSLDTVINKYQKSHFKYYKKLSFKDLLYIGLTKIANNDGYKPATHKYIYATKSHISTQAVHKAMKSIPIDAYKELSNMLYKKYLKNYDNRILLIDGSAISLPKSIMDENPDVDYRITSTKSYCKALLTTIYDLNHKAPMAQIVTTVFDERKAFLQLRDTLRPKDILIFDRGYYSLKMLKTLTKAGHFVIFRISRTNKKIYRLDESDNYKYLTRKVTYTIASTEYVMLTNLPKDIYPVDTIKNLYHSRWAVEEYYKVLKMQEDGKFYNCKSWKTLNQRLELQYLLNQLIATIYHINLPNPSQAYLQSKEKYSPTYALDYMCGFMYLLFYKPKRYLKDLKNLIIHVNAYCKTIIINNRKFPRIAVVNNCKWYRRKQQKSVDP